MKKQHIFFDLTFFIKKGGDDLLQWMQTARAFAIRVTVVAIGTQGHVAKRFRRADVNIDIGSS